jgi:thermostable 8-oxoguanine DNA glycosylase
MNYKLDPDNITRFDYSDDELQLNILFWIFAAGKNGHTAARCLNNFLSYWSKELGKTRPFEIIQEIENLPIELKNFGVGCFNNKAKTIKNLIEKRFNLEKCSLGDLESVWGLGPKSVRCFLIHTRKNQKYAGLDRHVLRYLRNLGYDVPDHTPNRTQYSKIEKIFLEHAEKIGKTISELDLEIWTNNRVLTK